MTITALDFYPRSPCGERLAQIRYLKLKLGFLSTLSLRRATHPRARCALGRPIFLSTLSLRRATASFNAAQPATQNFYPRSPCGERPLCCRSQARPFSISIHALLAESDVLPSYYTSRDYIFLSTLSLRRATRPCDYTSPQTYISIHALLAESDRPGLTRYYPGRNFYPRSPCGERPPCPRCSRGTLPISIHALLAESDRPTTSCTAAHKHFYPRSPCGERPMSAAPPARRGH